MGGTGKIEQASVRLVTTWPPAQGDSRDWQVLCPFLAGTDPSLAFWLGALAWHDANARLLECLRVPAHPAIRVYAGVFGVDPFRRDADLFSALHTAGVVGIVNLPSVSFIDGEFASLLDNFHLGAAREIDFLRRGHDAGFRIAGCAGNVEIADRLASEGADFIIAHGGPPQPGTPDPSRTVANRLRPRYAAGGPAVISAAELLATLTPQSRNVRHDPANPTPARTRH